MREWTIEPMPRTRTAEAAGVLGRAFAENPVARACLSHLDRRTRVERVTRLNRGLIEATRASGGDLEVARDGARIVGAQLSLPPGRYPFPVRAFLWVAAGALGTGARGTLRYWLYDHRTQAHHPSGPHFYLFLLGVEPELQGRGVGGALLRRFCARADARGLPGYLETDKLESVRIYERHGFVVQRELELAELSAGDGPLRIWTMIRPPGAGRGREAED